MVTIYRMYLIQFGIAKLPTISKCMKSSALKVLPVIVLLYLYKSVLTLNNEMTHDD